MEEITVTTAAEAAPETPAAANVFAFAPDDTGEENFWEDDPGDADQGAAEQDSEEKPAEEENGLKDGEDGHELEGKPQKEVGAAFAKANDRWRAKYEKQLAEDPDRAIGRRLVEDLMTRENLSEADARKTLEDRWTAAYAKRAGISEEVARDIAALKRQTKPNTQTEADFDPDTRAAEIKAEIESMTLPDGFDTASAYADPVFAELLLEMPTAAAVRVYHAEHKATDASTRADNAARDVAEKLKARSKIPMPEAPKAPVVPRVDYRKMSSEDFWAEKQRREKEMR